MLTSMQYHDQHDLVVTTPFSETALKSQAKVFKLSCHAQSTAWKLEGT